jgi:hypothetical protein
LAPAVATASSDVLPTAQDEALADGQVAADAAAASSLPAAATEPVAAKPEPAPATQVSTEAAQATSPGNDPQDEIFLAAADTPPQTSDPVVLPQLIAGTDPPPALSPPPPPFGTFYSFDAEGRIQPTPAGIVTPEGVLLIAGRPPVVPPTRPAPPASQTAAPVTATISGPSAAASTAATAVAAPTPALTSASQPFPSDPALADKRPKARPAGLVDPASATAKQGEALAPAAGSRFASLRPQARPAALTVPVTQAAATPPDAELANSATAASLAQNGVQPSSLAVITSKKPAARPSGLDQAVNAAVAAAISTPDPQPQQTANLAPESQPEPEVENAAPRLPGNASVARQATTKDAINLSRVALLGIFGTSSGRYAMVRQPTGGVKKIVVGDSIDGGSVAAITENAVQYQKGGRIVTLSLPTG